MCLALPVFHDHPMAPPKHHLIGIALCRSSGGKQPRREAVTSAEQLLIMHQHFSTAAAAGAGAAAAAAGAGPPEATKDH